MRIFRRRKQVHENGNGNGLAAARRERKAAELRLAHAEETVIVPLRQMRRENHIGPLMDALIQRRIARDGN